MDLCKSDVAKEYAIAVSCPNSAVEICFHIQVKYKFGELTAAKLKEAGVKLKFESYPGAHHVVCFQMTRDYLHEVQTEVMRLLARDGSVRTPAGMGHEARPEELQLVQSFLQQTFKD